MKRFRLRTLLLFITVVAIGFSARVLFPAIRYGNVTRFVVEDFSSGDFQTVTIAAGQADAANQGRLNALRDISARRFLSGSWVNLGPDASYRTIRLECQRGVIVLSSWHSVFEENPKVVAASYGVTSLGGLSREEFLEGDDQQYVAKRRIFDQIEEQLRRLNDAP